MPGAVSARTDSPVAADQQRKTSMPRLRIASPAGPVGEVARQAPATARVPAIVSDPTWALTVRPRTVASRIPARDTRMAGTGFGAARPGSAGASTACQRGATGGGESGATTTSVPGARPRRPGPRPVGSVR